MNEQQNMPQVPSGGAAQKNVTLIVIALLMAVIAVLLVMIVRERSDKSEQTNSSAVTALPAPSTQKSETPAVQTATDAQDATGGAGTEPSHDAAVANEQQKTVPSGLTVDQDMKAMEKDLDDGNKGALDDDELGDDQFEL